MTSPSPQDPLAFFPSESDATVVDRPKVPPRPSDAKAPDDAGGAEPLPGVAREYSRIQDAAAREAELQDLRRHTDERFEALTALAAETTAQLARREQLRDQLADELRRLETEMQTLTESGRRQTEASKAETVVWEDLRAQLRETERAIKQSVAESAELEGALEPLQGQAIQLVTDYSRIQDAAREAEQRILTAVETMKSVETRLGPLQDLSRQTDERFETLNALADVVTLREQTLRDHKETIDQAVVEAGRVAGLVDALQAQLATLNDGSLLLDRTEAQLQRLEAMAAETTTQLDRREQLRDDLARERLRVETDVQAFTESSRRRIEAAKTDAVILEGVRAQLRETELAVQQSMAEATSIKSVLDPLHAQAAGLASEYDRIQGAAREAEERGAAAVEAKLLRLEAVAAETTAELERREQLRDDLARERLRVEVDVQALTESSRRQIEAAKTDAIILEGVRAQLRETELAVKQSMAEAMSIKSVLDPLHAQAARLAGQYNRIQDAAREAEQRGVPAIETGHHIEERVTQLAALEDLSRRTDERLGTLNRLAEEVTRNVATLKNGDHLLEQTEARLRRLEGVAAETTAERERREQLGDDLAREQGAFNSRPFTLPVQHPDHPAPSEPVDVRVEPPLPAMDWEERWSPPPPQSAAVMTRLRIPGTVSLLKHGGAGVGLALLLLAGFFAMRLGGKTVPIDRQPLPAHVLPSLASSVPVLSGTTLVADEPTPPAIVERSRRNAKRPATATRPSATAARPPAVATRPAPEAAAPAEYVGTLAIASSPPGATVFIDRQPVGQTPLELPRVRAGSHVVRIEREGYQRWTAAVNVPASVVTQVTVKLDAEPVR